MYDTKKLKKIRKKFKYSIYYMAENLQISASYYSQLENKKRNLSYDMAIRIANILKTTPDNLFLK